ncbi:MAG: hypothetical protein BHV95_04110 [Clostridiales bacterium Nov_37_41]|nr:MAG: hypothetical protein BHV95_04110 [Clostridiales bacterium Nov_37_41]
MVNFMTEYVGEKKAWSIVYGIFGVIAAILFFLCFVPFGIVTFAIFAVPDVAKLYQIIYVFIAYNAMMSVYSLINIPYGSMATMMTKDQYQRTLLNIFRQLFAQIASLLVTAGTLPLINFMTEYVGEKKAWSIVYGIFGVIAAILFFLCFEFMKMKKRRQKRFVLLTE